MRFRRTSRGGALATAGEDAAADAGELTGGAYLRQRAADISSDRTVVVARVVDRARRAAAIIAAVTVVITVAGGILERVFDRSEFPTIGRGLWFALQTVTTVGDGDVTPKHADGRFIGAVVMLTGIGFLAVITASVTASLIEISRRRFAESEGELARQLQEVGARLVTIEALLAQPTPSESSARPRRSRGSMCDFRHTFPDRAGARVSHLPVPGDAHDRPHCGALRS